MDVHQLAVHPDLHTLTGRTQSGRYRVERLQALYVVIGMHLGVAPVCDLVGLAVPRDQCLTLLVLEDHQGLPVGGAVNALPRYIAAPALRLCSEVWQAIETAVLEEALPDVLDTPLHLGLVLGMPDSGRVGDETAALGWTLRILSGISEGICNTMVQSGGEFLYIGVGGR